MGYDSNMKAEDDSKRRGIRQKIIIAVLASLIINGLAFFAFQNVQGYNALIGGKLSVESKVGEQGATIAVQLKDALEEVRELRQENRMARDELVRAQEVHMKLLTQIESNTRAISGAQSDGERNDALKALEESIQNDPYHHWMFFERESLPLEFREYVAPKKLPFGYTSSLKSDHLTASIGLGCVANIETITEFMTYEVGKQCPDDDVLAQELLLAGCEPLPRRRCFARGPPNPTEPFPFPESMWTTPRDENIHWGSYECKSIECLNTRTQRKIVADCLDCFDLHGREASRWVGTPSEPPATVYTVEQVLALKKGTIRIGFDIGGGAASFAVRMREHNVTIITSTLNLAAPFNNFVAHRGVIPFFMTVNQRFPFWDNTLDIVHSMHVLSNWIPDESLEFILYDIDRVLRPGGIFWLDHFFCVQSELETQYMPLIRKLGYKELRWDVGRKLDRGPEKQEVYLSALLEKPMTRNF